MEVSEVLARFPDAKKNGAGWKARCPAHEDRAPSLSIAEGKNGATLLKCFAGCEVKSICSALGIHPADLFPTRNERPPRQIVATYDYQNADGALVFQVVRSEPKDFRQRRPDPKSPGSCIWNTNGIEKVLFRLPELLRDIQDGLTIFVSEGEKDVLEMTGHGFAATCNPGGAGKWRCDYSETLRGCDVVIVSDKDDAGRKHAQLVATSLHGLAKCVRVIELPDINGARVKDASDFFAAGGDAGKVSELADTAPEWTPAAATSAIAGTVTQSANGEETEGPEPNFYFDAGRKEYWTANNRGGWINVNETQFKRILRKHGTSPKVPEASYVSPLDEKLIDIQQQCDVHYAGALAGYRCGVYDMGERRILVTESPRIIEPGSGDWPTIHAVIDGLLHDERFDQQSYLLGWLKVSFETLQAGQRRPGQALVIAGVHGCGKSLLQNVITRILGGRSARPYQFMSGLTPFNSDLFEAEHLMIEDEHASIDIRARRNFGAQLKNITVVDWQRCHAKNRVAISLAPFWRLSVTVNDEPENLMVLPPIDDSIEDKLIILRASKFELPMPTVTLEQRSSFWQKLVDELPAFLHYLTQWEIPTALLSERFGITHFHHPEILQAIDNLAPEFRLLRLIDDELFQTDAAGIWEGSAELLERHLCADSSGCRNEARKLFTFNTACGVYLGRLSKRQPERFSSEHTRKGNQWTITPPKL